MCGGWVWSCGSLFNSVPQIQSAKYANDRCWGLKKPRLAVIISPNRWLRQQNDIDDQVTRIGVVVFQALCPIGVWREGTGLLPPAAPERVCSPPYSYTLQWHHNTKWCNVQLHVLTLFLSFFLFSPFATPVPVLVPLVSLPSPSWLFPGFHWHWMVHCRTWGSC